MFRSAQIITVVCFGCACSSPSAVETPQPSKAIARSATNAPAKNPIAANPTNNGGDKAASRPATSAPAPKRVISYQVCDKRSADVLLKIEICVESRQLDSSDIYLKENVDTFAGISLWAAASLDDPRMKATLRTSDRPDKLWFGVGYMYMYRGKPHTGGGAGSEQLIPMNKDSELRIGDLHVKISVIRMRD